VLTRQAGDAAKAFYGWLQQEEGRAILQQYGFRTD